MAIEKSENLKFSKKVLEKGSQSTQGEKTLRCYEGKMADNTRMQGLIYVLYYISQYPSNVIHTRNFQKLIFSWLSNTQLQRNDIESKQLLRR